MNLPLAKSRCSTRGLRNKIAHGQWKIALNRNNTSINQDSTTKLTNVNVVTIEIWKRAYTILSNIIEILIESPDRAFHREYWVEIENLQETLRETEKWSLETKIKNLKDKKSRHQVDPSSYLTPLPASA